jgi:hypothetical protein
MPFTFSHPAVVLPLTYLPRHWFSLTGLVIGSLTPDFEYFLRMRIESNYSHTLAGLFWFDLPLGLLIAFVFHHMVRNDLFDNLPKFFKSRCLTFRQFNWNMHFKRNWYIVLISILIGAASHIIWDSFTHEYGFFVQTYSELSNAVDILGKQMSISKLLQHSSTLLGGMLIIFAIYKLPADRSVSAKINLKYWAILTGLTLVILFIRLFSGLELNQYGNLIVTAISAVLISLIVTPLVIKTNKG